MSWGTKLIIAMGLFMAFIIALSARMMMSGTDDLVEKDYYEKGLSYDQDYIRKQNVERDGAAPDIVQSATRMEIRFKTKAAGKLKFTHARNKKLDRAFILNTDDKGEVSVPLAGIERGSWRLTFEWKGSADKSYLYEREFFVQ
ncbi:FixH family protein [Arcticibacter sp. MXS-1]|uniref:FixH family protein n=1 Tax=Arcticibacter sp. MXS-1 TaxID=3341726 RepID=UPI0035A94511